jgi:hypothetical protein
MLTPKNKYGSAGIEALDRFGDELDKMLSPKLSSVSLTHSKGDLTLYNGVTIAVKDSLEEIDKVTVTGRVCTFNINAPICVEGDDVYEVEHLDSALAFIETVAEHYDVFVIHSLPTLISLHQSAQSMDKANYKGVLRNLVAIHQAFIKINKPCVITNHISNGNVYLGELVNKYAKATVFL